jgi:hypothetical protein
MVEVCCILQDIATLGVINVRYCGYIAIVQVAQRENDKASTTSQSIELLDQPEGGANALNINRYSFTLRMCQFDLCIINNPYITGGEFVMFVVSL